VTAAATTPNYSQVRAAITGFIKYAPLGTAVPTDVTTAWAPGWIDLGSVDDKGITDSNKLAFNAVRAWQSAAPVRQLLKTQDPGVKFAALQLNWATYQAWSGASSSLVGGVYKVSMPPTVVANEWMLGIEFHDGTLVYRKWFNRGMFINPGDITYEKGTPIMASLEYGAMPVDTTTDLETFLTNDTNFASS
jgi:hypothetical protein